jgi:hypothetical protein
MPAPAPAAPAAAEAVKSDNVAPAPAPEPAFAAADRAAFLLTGRGASGTVLRVGDAPLPEYLIHTV